ncbi:hypothetical protein [Porcipelethomonas sp.]|uniref:hypothetical protein n=1 Tax=Porcipelethomonas sp. TaxID=2981675 RepID=UPI003EF41E73
MQKRYIIAEHITEINSLYDYVHNQCKDYLYIGNKSSDIIISTSDSDIECERQKSQQEDLAEGIPVRDFSNDYLESLSVYRKLAESIIKDGYFLFHGSAVALDGNAYLFAASSGTGKSTHTNLWLRYFGSRAEIINGDKPIIKITSDNKAVIFGTPWCGKENLNINKSAPLKAICILKRDTVNHIEPISLSKAYPMLLQQCYRPKDSEKMSMTLSLLDKLENSVKLYSLGCNTDIQAAVTAYNGMK